MYWRACIRDGDTTTVGGKVHARPLPIPSTYGDSRQHACHEGDPVYCPACKSMGVTKCVMPYRPDQCSDGRQLNLDGDLCICKCPSPPRLKALFDSPRVGFETSEIVSMKGIAGWLLYAGFTSLPIASPAKKHGKVVEFKDSVTGKLLTNRKLIINDSGTLSYTKTDSKGLAFIEAPAGHIVSIHLVFKSPKGEINYKV